MRRREFKKKSLSVLMVLMMAVAMMFAGVGCGNNSADEVVNDDATLAAEATYAEETTEATEETSETTTETTEETSTEETTKATTKATKATTKAAQVCYVSVEGYCSNKCIEISKGDTAYTVLKKTDAAVSAENTQFGIYVKAINGKSEFDEGDDSGWKYSVNGTPPNKSAGSFSVKNGDVVKWYYVTSY